MKPGFIYIITNKNNTTLYVGVTSNLPERILQHREKRFKNSFSEKYNLDKLVYWEAFQEIGDAIGREKQLKAGSRQKKIELINSFNPDWIDLYDSIQDIMNPF
ncbi:GIY-YIG nuclease family protein [Kaistella yonginensis]|uniref:GIY-YIG nuclease family protein n=1 Tax=Kaistella yonginensis TaxID=658267 RepID=UPI0025B42741|nr:GIY-YIG nuclease family protein [Kaistella yonginensis]MDN3606538.1 GIY-YIG nuclease family protein [Kaistella yonginensis]